MGYEINFLTPIKPERENDRLLLGELELLYDKDMLTWDYEVITLEDKKLSDVWGTLYRVSFKSVQKTIAGTVVFEIKNINK